LLGLGWQLLRNHPAQWLLDSLFNLQQQQQLLLLLSGLLQVRVYLGPFWLPVINRRCLWRPNSSVPATLLLHLSLA
jgi:hypothetical protein